MPFVIAICGLEFSTLLQIAAVFPATSQKSDGCAKSSSNDSQLRAQSSVLATSTSTIKSCP
jgi:hypothetical protein